MAIFRTAFANMLVGGPKKLKSGEDRLVESEDPAQIQWMRKHPYCEEVKDGGADKGRTGSKKGSDRPAASKVD